MRFKNRFRGNGWMRNLSAKRTSAPNLIFWLPTFAGVLVLLAVLIFTLLRLHHSPGSTATRLPEPLSPFAPLEPLTPASFLPAPSTSPADARPTAVAGSAVPPGTGPRTLPTEPAGNTPTARPSHTPSRTVRPSPSPPTMSGSYHVLQSFSDGFIGEVLVSNVSQQPQNWTVTLRFPSSVGPLNTSWVESAPQASLSTSGSTYTWRSGAPVVGGSSVSLRFHFNSSGGSDLPSTCTVNGAACKL
jgi:hypothetical protein